MITSIPRMDQKILNKYYPGQAVKNVMRTPTKSLRGYTVTNNRGLIIATAKLKPVLAAYASQIALKTRWNTTLSSEGNHLVCLLNP